MRLLGVDVGFSNRRKTTGIAWLDHDKLGCVKVGSAWEERKQAIPDGFVADFIALDGPLIPAGAPEDVNRRCERIFIRSPFHNRCKPGLSHWGVGLELRRAASLARDQFSQTLAESGPNGHEPVGSRDRIVEAFPNAFLGVLLEEDEFHNMPALRRGQRFDWLYDRVVKTGKLESTLSKELALPAIAWQQLREECDHERRAAFICLLTAAVVACDAATRIGDAEGGYFWLPQTSFWQGWAVKGLESAEKN